MNKKTLKFNSFRVNKKKFHLSKEPIDLMSVNIDQIILSDKFKLNNKDSNYFIDYQKGKIVKPLCIFYFKVFFDQR